MFFLYGNRIQMEIPDVIGDQLIKDIITTHETNSLLKQRYLKLQSYYNGTYDVRTNATENTSDNKILNDYAGYIVDTIHGYWLGKPVNYTSTNKPYMVAIQDIYDANNEAYHNSIVGRQMGIKGESFEIVYVNENKEMKFVRVPQEEMVVIYDISLDPQIELAIRYYTITDVLTTAKFRKVELYWKDKVQYYTEMQGNFILNEEVPHFFGEVPVIHYENSDERIGDFEKVLSQINEYSTRLSNNANELDYMREAYLKLSGVVMDEEAIKALGKKGIIALEEGGDAQFLIKNLQDVFNQNHMNRINGDIHKFTKVPDLSDEKFAGNLSGVAIEYKLWGLEQIAVIKEAMFEKALKRRLRLITTILNLKGGSYDSRDIEITFTRNMPTNALEEVDKTIKSQQLGLLSDEKLLSMLPFVDDPAYELLKYKKQQAEKATQAQPIVVQPTAQPQANPTTQVNPNA